MDYKEDNDKYIEDLRIYYNKFKKIYSKTGNLIKSLGDASIIDNDVKYNVQFDILYLAANIEKVEAMLNSFDNFVSLCRDGFVTITVLSNVKEKEVVNGFPRVRK